MADRDDLIAVLHAAQCLDAQQGHCDDAVCPQAVGVQADAVLARWRLVPVGEGCVGRDHQWQVGAPTCTRCGYVSEQHRAASELTRHDNDAGVYEPQMRQLFRNTITGSVFRYIGNDTYNPVMLGDQPARGMQLTYPYTESMAGPLKPYTNDDGCACGRTDNHGPHEE